MKLKSPAFSDAAIEDLISEVRQRWNVLYESIRVRRQHYYNEPEADPILPPPYDKGRKFQSDALRQTKVKVKARMTENHFVVQCHPAQPTATQKADADALEAVMNSGLILLEERMRFSIQGDLADPAVIDGPGWLHWCKAVDIYPEMTEEYVDELPEDETEAERYEESEEEGKPRYKETGKSYEERRNFARARAGFPWYVECPDSLSIAAVPDRSMENGFAMIVVEREIGLLDYARDINAERAGERILSMNDADKDIPFWQEHDAPAEDMPSGDDIKHKVKLYQVWTRDECYEAVEGDKSFEVVKSFKHPHKMPPFALVVGDETNSTDPARRFLSYMEGIYRQKPGFDKRVALIDIMTEAIATPLYYLKKIPSATGMPDFTEEGDTVYFTRNALAAMKVPDGYEIAQIATPLNPAVIQGFEILLTEFREAFPSTGEAEIDANTKPWTARLGLQQANATPKALLNGISNAIQTMVRNMTMVMSLDPMEGGLGEVTVFARDKETGDVDYATTVSILPEQIRTLDVSVVIEPESAAERLTKEEHGMDMFERGHISETVMVEEYFGRGNPLQFIMQKRVEKWFAENVEPSLLKQETVKRYGNRVVLGPASPAGSGMYGPDGQEVQPQQVLQANGFRPAGIGPGVAPIPGPAQPPMPGMTVPGTMPMAGIPT